MFPVIFKIGPITIYSYGLMVFIAVMVTLNLLVNEAKKKGFDKDTFFDLGITIILSGIVGARLLYVLLNLDIYLDNPKEIFMLHHGGLAVLGGVVMAMLASAIFIKIKKLPFLVTLDIVAPFIALGQSIGRIGCLFNGCCYGFPCPIGFYFPVHEAILFPVQLLDSFLMLILYIFLRARQCKPHSKGIIFAMYILFSSLIRFFVEFIRADSLRPKLNLTIFQYFCLALFVFGLILLYKIKWKNKISK